MFKENQDCNQDKWQKRTVGQGYESGSWVGAGEFQDWPPSLGERYLAERTYTLLP